MFTIVFCILNPPHFPTKKCSAFLSCFICFFSSFVRKVSIGHITLHMAVYCQFSVFHCRRTKSFTTLFTCWMCTCMLAYARCTTSVTDWAVQYIFGCYYLVLAPFVIGVWLIKDSVFFYWLTLLSVRAGWTCPQLMSVRNWLVIPAPTHEVYLIFSLYCTTKLCKFTRWLHVSSLFRASVHTVSKKLTYKGRSLCSIQGEI